MDQAELQSSVGNWSGVQKLNERMNRISTVLDYSICRCFDCNSFEKDRVFFNEEVYYFMHYPPVSASVREPRTWWLCPECYQNRMEILELYKKEKYYYYHKTGMTATLDQIGLKKLKDYNKFP
ncbi:hypothetical protein LCGC14_0498140 [marine sediment metagenome]|uniref:Uncharacterized protein n=1 Tax=marine sediment metagenome TaxID=412755 RepID=A0A0F9S4M0_9ZZZZ